MTMWFELLTGGRSTWECSTDLGANIVRNKIRRFANNCFYHIKMSSCDHDCRQGWTWSGTHPQGHDCTVSITISAPSTSADFLNVSLRSDGSFRPFRKADQVTNYVHRVSNHPPSIIKNLLAMIEYWTTSCQARKCSMQQNLTTKMHWKGVVTKHRF